MKKLIITATAIVFAVVTQAATVNWQGAVCEQDGVTEVKVGQSVLLAWSATQGSLASTIEDTAIGTIADNGYEIVSSYQLTAGDVVDFAFSAAPFERTDAAGGVNGYYQMLLISDDGNSFAVADVGQITSITDSTGAGMIDFNKGWDNYDDFVGNSGYIGTVGGGPGPEPVPEPTSGLLLLLGMAGLALKRKCA